MTSTIKDDVKALQIKVAVLEHLLINDPKKQAEYAQLLKIEAERLLLEQFASCDPNRLT